MPARFIQGACLRSLDDCLSKLHHTMLLRWKRRGSTSPLNNAAKREKWSRVEYEVTINEDESIFTCECGQFEHTGMLCSHALRVMEILHLEEIPKYHVIKRWTKDARDILPGHLVQYQRDNSQNMSFTCRHATLNFKAMEVVRMGDASAACYEHVNAALDSVIRSAAPLAEKRDGLAFEDRVIPTTDARISANGEQANADLEAEHCASAGNSFSTNAMRCLTAPEKRRGPGRPTNSREKAKASYEGLSKRTRFCSICRREGHKKTTCPDRGDMPKKPRKPGKCKNCGIEPTYDVHETTRVCRELI
ncbi:hypothetical protein ACQJBY_012697 [Aegilops geniculata]